MTFTIGYRSSEPETGRGALEPYEPEPDASRADWVVEGCYGPLWTLHRIVPECFEQYICVRHPGWRWPDVCLREEFLTADPETQLQRMIPARWSEVAREFGHDPAKSMRWSSIAPDTDYANPRPGDLAPPLEGKLPLEVLDTVFDALLSHSGADQECVCATWEGFGNHEVKAMVEAGAARIEGMAQQGHYLMRASLGTVLEQWRSVLISKPESCGLTPQAVWPATGTWFFAVPFEMHASFLGGITGITSKLLSSPFIDAYTVPSDVSLL